MRLVDGGQPLKLTNSAADAIVKELNTVISKWHNQQPVSKQTDKQTNKQTDKHIKKTTDKQNFKKNPKMNFECPFLLTEPLSY